MSKKRQALNIHRRSFVKRILDERLLCEARIAGCSMMPSDVHEICSRGRGGSIIDDENVLALCRPCHQFVTVNPAWAAENGFLLHANPTDADIRAAERARFAFVFGVGDIDDD